MKSKQTQDVMLEALKSFANTIQSKFGAVADGREEDQLRRLTKTASRPRATKSKTSSICEALSMLHRAFNQAL